VQDTHVGEPEREEGGQGGRGKERREKGGGQGGRGEGERKERDRGRKSWGGGERVRDKYPIFMLYHQETIRLP
jgi:hypothetical protein